MKTALITGVSSGIGLAAAMKFLSEGYRVIGTYRTKSSVEALVQQFGGQFVGLELDVSDHESIGRFAQLVVPLIKESGLDVCMNNAGIATVGGIIDQDMEEYYRQFEVNVFGPLKIMRILLPYLKANKGVILQIGSVSGELVYPFMSAYSASKHAMEAQSDGFRRELSFIGIKVIHFQFGPVNTPIWNKISPKAIELMQTSLWKAPFERFLNYMKSRGGTGIDPQKIAQLLFKVSNLPRPKPRYAVLKERFSSWTLPRILPTTVVDKSMQKALGLQ